MTLADREKQTREALAELERRIELCVSEAEAAPLRAEAEALTAILREIQNQTLAQSETRSSLGLPKLSKD